MIKITQHAYNPWEHRVYRLSLSIDENVAILRSGILPISQMPALGLIDLLYSYEPNSLIAGLPPERRPLFREVPIPFGNTEISIMLRVLATMTPILRVREVYELLIQNRPIRPFAFRQLIAEHMSLDVRNILNHQIYFEKTGRTGNQPTFYFVSADLTRPKRTADQLFHEGFLYKFLANFGENIFAYYVPFTPPELSLESPVFGASRSILKAGNKRLREFLAR